MPTFTPGDTAAWSREDLRLLQNGFVTLFHDEGVLAEYLSWFAVHRYGIHDVDGRAWHTGRECQVAIGKALSFPEDFRGHSLDAFRDRLGDVATYELGADPSAAGTVLVLRHYDRFARWDGQTAHAILDIWAEQARVGLLFGHRMLCFVQSDDPTIAFGEVGASAVMWNPREWPSSNRRARR